MVPKNNVPSELRFLRFFLDDRFIMKSVEKFANSVIFLELINVAEDCLPINWLKDFKYVLKRKESTLNIVLSMSVFELKESLSDIFDIDLDLVFIYLPNDLVTWENFLGNIGKSPLKIVELGLCNMIYSFSTDETFFNVFFDANLYSKREIKRMLKYGQSFV